jgi:uncharacterized protein (TIGR00730 family)
VRILSEYAEPLARFRRERVQDTIVFFGSARIPSLENASRALKAIEQGTTAIEGRTASPEISADSAGTQPVAHAELLQNAKTAVEMSRYYEDARQLASLLAKWSQTLKSRRQRFVVTSGGGPGIMEAANRGAAEAGSKTVGLNIHLPFEQSANPYITPSLNFEFHYFFMRKFWFAYLAKALVVFPGGFGTLDEMFELLALIQTQKLAKHMTVVVYGEDYWKSVVDFEFLVKKRTIAAEDLNLFHFANTPEEAFEFLRSDLTKYHLEVEEKRQHITPEEESLLNPEIARTR